MTAQGIEEVCVTFAEQSFIVLNKVRKQVFNCANGLIPVEEIESILGPYESQQLSDEDIIRRINHFLIHMLIKAQNTISNYNQFMDSCVFNLRWVQELLDNHNNFEEISMFYEGLDVLRKDLRELEEGLTSLGMYAFAISLTSNCFAVNQIRAHRIRQLLRDLRNCIARTLKTCINMCVIIKINVLGAALSNIDQQQG